MKLPHEHLYVVTLTTLNGRIEWHRAVYAESDSAIVSWLQKSCDFNEYRYICIHRDGDVVMEYKRKV